MPPTPPTSSPEMRLNTNIPNNMFVSSDANNSPRTKVAYNFQGLQLEDGGAVSRLDLRKSNTPKLEPYVEGMEDENSIRKRLRILGGHADESNEPRMEVPETPDARKSFAVVISPERVVDPILNEKAEGVILHNEIDPAILKSGAARKIQENSLIRTYPSINRLADSKSRAPRKRMGTPPLFGSAEASLETQNGNPDNDWVVESERAAQTWHDNEITGHNPDDPDDDGEGINGIGFKPTPAIAYARTEKRRAQMAEYRNREAREARAKRSERRRGSEMSKSSKEEQETARRVRFLEKEANSIISNH